jgi:3-methylcrotonyl-CoA carboxylase alpha subunit
MIAKLIAHGETRDEARERLSDMLDESAVWPVKTNAAFLIQALAIPTSLLARSTPVLIGRDGEAMAAEPQPSAAALADAAFVAGAGRPKLRLPPQRARSSHPPRSCSIGERVEVELEGEGTDEPVAAILLAEGGMVWELTPCARTAATAGMAATARSSRRCRARSSRSK